MTEKECKRERENPGANSSAWESFSRGPFASRRLVVLLPASSAALGGHSVSDLERGEGLGETTSTVPSGSNALMLCDYLGTKGEHGPPDCLVAQALPCPKPFSASCNSEHRGKLLSWLRGLPLRAFHGRERFAGLKKKGKCQHPVSVLHFPGAPYFNHQH